MANKSITQDASINESSRIREAARTFVEECRRKHDERTLSEVTVATYHGTSRQVMFTPRGKDFFRGSENYREEASEDSELHPQEIEVPWFPGVRVRLVPGAPYYIN